MRASPPIRKIYLCADNSSAIATINSLTTHAGQAHSIQFCNAVTEFLEADERNKVIVRWTPGHEGIDGNEEADARAKIAASTTAEDNYGPTWTHMRRAANARALAEWTTERRSTPSRSWFAAADRIQPSLRPASHFYRLAKSRHIFGLVTQCRTGHAFTGEYYDRFVPMIETDCPCGAGLQTCSHILTECERYDAHRHILTEAVPSLHIPDILGTEKGITALAKFISVSGAFTKTGDFIVAQEEEAEQN